MEAATVTKAVTIRLESGCDHTECAQFAFPLYKQLAEGGYHLCSVLPLPASVDEWRDAHRTARKRADRCKRRGYRFVDVLRHERADEIYEINISAATRQGRPMTPGYSVRPSSQPDPVWPCRRHGVHCYGVEADDGRLVSYMWVYRAGELGLVSQILGHDDYLDDEIMWLQWEGVIQRELWFRGYLVYNLHDSGQEGLRWHKERAGFVETLVEWQP